MHSCSVRHVFRSVTFVADSLQAIRTGQIPRVSVLLGGVEDEGTIFAPIYNNVSFFLGAQLGRISFYRPPNATVVNSLYPGLNDTQVLEDVIRDELFRWCALHFALRKKRPNV
jgi:carboxylesterase type B